LFKGLLEEVCREDGGDFAGGSTSSLTFAEDVHFRFERPCTSDAELTQASRTYNCTEAYTGIFKSWVVCF
jgi:hypothetical protein